VFLVAWLPSSFSLAPFRFSIIVFALFSRLFVRSIRWAAFFVNLYDKFKWRTIKWPHVRSPFELNLEQKMFWLLMYCSSNVRKANKLEFFSNRGWSPRLHAGRGSRWKYYLKTSFMKFLLFLLMDHYFCKIVLVVLLTSDSSSVYYYYY
jgi:hypothetical protein